MPTYTFQCQICYSAKDVVREVPRRNDPVVCECTEIMQRMPEMFRANVFVPYYDEALGEDLYSFADKRRSMAEIGVREAGDRVGGARNFDKIAPEHVSKSRPRGIRRKDMNHDPIVEIRDENNQVSETKRMSELPNYNPSDSVE